VVRILLIVAALVGCRGHFAELPDGSSDGDGTGPDLGCVTAFTGYGEQVCAIRTDKTVVCWGIGTRGQLGDGNAADRLLPGPAQITDVDAIAGGEDTVCVTKTDGSLWCWGVGDLQQIGDGGGANRLLPVNIPLADRVIEAASSEDHTCARLGNGSAFCWGSNSDGQLGVTVAGVSAPTPVHVNAIDGSLAMSLGDYATCILRADQTVACWGINTEGELGDGTLVSRAAPARVMSIVDPVTQIAGGCHRHWCAVTTFGDVWCWGQNSSGEVGTGMKTPVENIPIQVAGLPTVDQVAVGGFHTCARTRAGEVWCWGDNATGELGDTTFTDRPSPVRSSFVGTPVDIQASCSNTEVLRDDRRLVGWGSSVELGTGETVDRATAAEIPVPCP
jgi:alpha-tubulin suppressor-like RCC1 family protein